ncbi:hypothetical protein [Paraburkholderia humisilvae]|uniref:Tc1-like transposase DDE domain-containing protein n=1 Tax=Paraburkholderia humisilvae TaxID=627669 RepID=A0A6J5F9F3_9BURK|nr:hypothetical protein [Paraburkholderia humisilvae]CAB3774421.1 hypothetical protein LMG29542_07799 [Paraburkholderia humisilvae]
MERVAAPYPGKQVHVVWDNLNTHRAQALWHTFNARHGKQRTFTSRRCTRLGQSDRSHTSTVHLRECTGQLIREHNQAAHPFKWSSQGYPLRTGAL